METNESPSGESASGARLELLVDDATWMIVPAGSDGAARATRWISFDPSISCDLEAWR